jgi:lipopolysaccharide export system protein LptC
METAQPEETTAQPEARFPYRARDWRISPRATLLHARRYSAFVKVMKGALPMAALALGIVVLAYSLQPRDQASLSLTFESMAQIEGDLTMIKPRLSGTDENGRPFVVTAGSASQQARGSDLVRLKDIAADIGLNGGMPIHVTAAAGVMDTKSHKLDISGGIRVVSEDGYDASAASAVADLRAGTVRGENGIRAHGGFGELTAERFTFEGDTRRMRFSGRVRMLLNTATTIAP